MKKILIASWFLLAFGVVAAQDIQDSIRQERIYLDSLFLKEVEKIKPDEKPKVFHAEPLYIDLIRDLGARKGEKEWNVAFGMTDLEGYDRYEALIEYEWAPIDRLGFEIEVPLTVYSAKGYLSNNIEKPANRVESLKVATQWSFLVSEKFKTSLALGYIHEFEFVDIDKLGGNDLFKGNVYNPFFIAAKRWGSNYHTLIYTGPKIGKHFNQKADFTYEINSNFHYMIAGTRNFIGIEVNKELSSGKMQTVIRPQMRLGLAENLMVGIVTGIPLKKEDERMSSFVRIIYEPGFRAMH